MKLITPDNSVIPSLNVANKIIINKIRVGASFHILIKKEDFLISSLCNCLKKECVLK